MDFNASASGPQNLSSRFYTVNGGHFLTAMSSSRPQLIAEDQLHHHRFQPNQFNLVLSSSSSHFGSFLSKFAPEINHHKNEIERFLLTQEEQFRRALTATFQKYYLALEFSTADRLRDKETEVELARRRNAELQHRIGNLRAESIAWEVRAMADQATAASLHMQLQRALAAWNQGRESAESAYVDPERIQPPRRRCESCRRRPASVVFLPCRHLCVCDACDAAVRCPVCRTVRMESIRVYM